MDDPSQAMFQKAAREVVVQYMSVASLTLLICDYLYTFELEVSLIWPQKWNLGQALFFMSRYSAFIDMPLNLTYYLNTKSSIEECRMLDLADSCFQIIGISAAEAILVIRTYGLVGRNKKFLTYLIAQYTVLYIAILVVFGISAPTWRHGPAQVPTIRGCHLTDSGSPILFLAFVLLLLHELIVMVITLVIGYKKYRNHRTPLIRTLYRDGTIYFVLIFAVSLASIICIATGPGEYFGLFTAFQRVIHGILSTRIVLHVRKAAQRDAIEIGFSDFNLKSTVMDEVVSTTKGTSTGEGTTNQENSWKTTSDV